MAAARCCLRSAVPASGSLQAAGLPLAGSAAARLLRSKLLSEGLKQTAAAAALPHSARSVGSRVLLEERPLASSLASSKCACVCRACATPLPASSPSSPSSPPSASLSSSSVASSPSVQRRRCVVSSFLRWEWHAAPLAQRHSAFAHTFSGPRTGRGTSTRVGLPLGPRAHASSAAGATATWSETRSTLPSADADLDVAPHILRAALRYGPRVAIVDSTGQRHTYCDLFRAALRLADAFGVQPQDPATVVGGGSEGGVGPLPAHSRVAIFSKPGAEFVASVWGAWLAGHVAVPLCTTHPAAELLYVLQNSEAALVVGPEEARGLLEPLAQQTGAQFMLQPPVERAPSAADNGAGGGDGAEAEDVTSEMEARLEAALLEGSEKGALFIYTSGTTGRPKGVVHTHAGLAAQAHMLVLAWEYTPSDKFLHVLPLHHVHGVMNALLSPLSAGATVEFMPKFSPGHMWGRLRRSYPEGGANDPDAVTVFTGVPTHYVRLLQSFDAMSADDQAASSYAASRLRLMMSGSAACPEPVMQRWETVTGHRLLERYGMTEFGMGLSNPLHGDRRLGCVGFPLKGVQAKVRYAAEEESSGSDADDGPPEGRRGGELLIRSPGMFREYWKRPEANAEAFDEEGYFLTGDTVAQDEEGYFKILGRTSVDIIKMGGYKLSALEIEALLLDNPQISECAVLGVPDADYGEAVAVVVVCASADSPLTLRDLKRWSMERMAHYKIPTKLRVIESMPRNAMGKVNKKELRKMLFDDSVGGR